MSDDETVVEVGAPVEGTNVKITSWRRVTGGPPPFLSWCLIVRNAEETLEATLRSIRERTPDAEIVVVDTMSRDRSPEIAQRYADVWVEWAGPRGEWDRDMPWFDDAAAARQHAFELASGRWRAWIDSDDVLPGPDEVRRLLALNNRWEPKSQGAKSEGAGKTVGLEDLLRLLDERHPDCDCVWAPYLYQRDAQDIAMVWQERERIVRWDAKRWHWREAAHEILVPDGPPPPKVYFDHLLFVHEKKFTAENTSYAVSRHYAVMLAQYEAGDVTTRRAQYLGWYARQLAPERELEFIHAAHTAATHSLDRYRAKLDEGDYWKARGIYHDALEAYGAATTLLPQIPDAWARIMHAAEEFHDDARAIDAGEHVMLCEAGQMESSITPRQHQLEYACRLADAYGRQATARIGAGFHELAERDLSRALELEVAVYNHDAVGPDKDEARARAAKAANALKAHQHAIGLDKYLQFLCDNDEPLKAIKVLRSGLAWNMENHPIAAKWARKLQVVLRHWTDRKAYEDFYADKTQTGAVFSPDAWLDPNGPEDAVTLQRAKWAAAWINEHCPNGRVVDVGCFDGIVGIPLLRLCPGITYVGLDVYVPALDEFRRRAERFGVADRVELHAVSVDDIADPAALGGPFDVALWMELIEHVQSPKSSLRNVLSIAKAALVTTPWGSYDAGHPPPGGAHGSVRDNRGHLRAYTPQKFMVDCHTYFSTVEELRRIPGPAVSTGDSMNAVISRREDGIKNRPVTFAVSGALWPWNGTVVRRDGIGASEETIVYLAERLAGQDHPAMVLGPVPEEEVLNRVMYSRRVDEWVPSLRADIMDEMKADEGVFVVSRAPTYDRALDAATAPRKHAKVLWLQDAYYPELTEEVARRYRKVVVVSEWHKQAMHERHGVPLDLMEVIYNFVLPEHFRCALCGNGDGASHVLHSEPRKNDHFIYASSPDRGLIRLLEVWPKIRAALPEATLSIFYGWKGAARLSVSGQYGWQQRYESQRRRFEELRHQPGVAFHGMVNHERIAREYQRAGVWLYPTKFEETCCTAAIKARVAGAVPVCPPLAALAETANGKTTGWLSDVDDDEEVVEQALAAAQVPEAWRREESARALAEYSVDGEVMARWRKVLAP